MTTEADRVLHQVAPTGDHNTATAQQVANIYHQNGTTPSQGTKESWEHRSQVLSNLDYLKKND